MALTMQSAFRKFRCCMVLFASVVTSHRDAYAGLWPLAPPTTTQIARASHTHPRSLLTRFAPRAHPHAPRALSAAEVITRVVEENLDLQAARTAVGMAEADALHTVGRYDLQLSAQLNHRIDKSARSAAAIFGSRVDTTNAGVNLSKHLPSGTDIAAGLTATRFDTRDSAFIAPLQYTAATQLSVRQPLLRNAFGRADRDAVSAARAAVRATDASVQRLVQRAVHDGVLAYWHWVAAHAARAIAIDALHAAEDFASITTEQFAHGTAQDTDRAAANAQVAARHAAIFTSDAEILAIGRVLAQAVRLPSVEQYAPSHIMMTIPAADPITTTLNVALTQRPDLQSLRHLAEQQSLQLRMTKSSTLPQLDLVSTLALNQLTTTNVPDALQGMHHPNWYTGVELAIPLQQRGVKGARDAAALAQTKTLLELKSVEEDIVREVRECAARLALARTEIFERERAALLYREKAALMRERFTQSLSTSDQVIRAQDEFTIARQQALDARLRGMTAWVDYQFAAGTLP